MKRIWVSIIILILLISVCSLGAQASQTHTDHILSTITALKDTAESGEEERAVSMSVALIDEWEESHRVLCMYMSHNRLEAIDDTIAALPSLLRGGERAQFTAECERAAAQIRQLTVTEQFSLENIL